MKNKTYFKGKSLENEKEIISTSIFSNHEPSGKETCLLYDFKTSKWVDVIPDSVVRDIRIEDNTGALIFENDLVHVSYIDKETRRVEYETDLIVDDSPCTILKLEKAGEILLKGR